jgi:hypothetical protein
MSDKKQWQPIESAPKDGRWILVFFTGDLLPIQSRLAVTRWFGGEWRNDGGDRRLAEADLWQPCPGAPQ